MSPPTRDSSAASRVYDQIAALVAEVENDERRSRARFWLASVGQLGMPGAETGPENWPTSADDKDGGRKANQPEQNCGTPLSNHEPNSQ